MFDLFKNDKITVSQKNEWEKYCVYVSQEIDDMVNNISSDGFVFERGYEFHNVINSVTGRGGEKQDNVFMFDLPETMIIAFDSSAKQMIHLFIHGNTYLRYIDSPNGAFKYDYRLIPYSDIYNVKLNIDKQTTFTTRTDKGDLFKRTMIGAALAGNTGAIIGGLSAGTHSEVDTRANSVELIIQTMNHDIENIIIESKSEDYGIDNMIRNVKYGILSGGAVSYFEMNTNRECKTKHDVIFGFPYKPLESEDEVLSRHIDGMVKNAKDIALIVDRIIHENSGNGSSLKSGMA